jgi:hypothetical protein
MKAPKSLTESQMRQLDNQEIYWLARKFEPAAL